MLIRRLLAVLWILCLTLGGCQVSGEVENQAYVLVLALDRSDDGMLALTARVPRIGKTESTDEKGDSGQSPYLTFSVSAPTWAECLDALQWATPRRINLSHIEMIVITKALASEAAFPQLINQISDTPHLYTTASFVVCEGSAGRFLAAGKTIIGNRMSAEIRAMLKQYAAQGFIPAVCLADACYAINSIYGDPVAIWGYTDASKSGASRLGEKPDLDSRILSSPMIQRFCGAALFRDGQFIQALGPDDTQLLNLLRGQNHPVALCGQESSYVLVPDGPIRKAVRFNGDDITLTVSLSLSVSGYLTEEATLALENVLKSDISSLIASCQYLGCDPFGFAESAARHFPTVESWLTYGWREHYSKADTELLIHIQGH